MKRDIPKLVARGKVFSAGSRGRLVIFRNWGDKQICLSRRELLEVGAKEVVKNSPGGGPSPGTFRYLPKWQDHEICLITC